MLRVAIITLMLICGCAADGIVRIDSPTGGASGVIVDKADPWYYVATAAHVVRSSPGLTIDGRPCMALEVDVFEDVAIIVFGSDQAYRVYGIASPVAGESCRLIGYPAASDCRPRLTQYGHVSCHSQGSIFVDTGTMPGFSGGAILNDWGQVIGICSGCPFVSGHIWESVTVGPDGWTVGETLRRAQECPPAK